MRALAIFIPSIVLFLAGCATTPPVAQPVSIPEEIASSRPSSGSPASTPADPRLAAGIRQLDELSTRMNALQQDFSNWWQSVPGRKKGVFTSDETDRIGCLLFRYMIARGMLWDMIRLYAACDRNFTGTEDQTKAFVIGYSAAILLDNQSSRLVAQFIDEPVAVRKMNEIHRRYDIPADTFDSIFLSVTSPSNIRALGESQRYVAAERAKTDSLLARIVRTEPDYARLLEQSDASCAVAVRATDHVLKNKSIVLPAVANFLRQNWLAEASRKLGRQLGDNLYIAQGILFNNVSDIKRPMTPPADFNPDQVRLIKDLLQPGDLIFTFTSGYMSNVFLPGKFKHGITYIGTPEQRAAIGLKPDAVKDVPPGRLAKLAEDLATAKLPTGYNADVIEAVAEGVIFNSLDYLIKHHVNRMAVLRPRIGPAERIDALANTFLLLGGMYDFNFDFIDTSYQCCTEVIYRSYNKKGGIEFTLVPRMAVKTLAADDIIQYHLSTPEPRFDLVVFAEENPESPIHLATVLTGEAAARRLHAVMTEKAVDLSKWSLNLPSPAR